NPELSIWVITGDGDGLSIGGNHLLHALRRNVDINVILFNNRIYGLTKGQYSPTSLPGTVTKSSPMGSIEQSFNPISVAIGAEATFIARTIDSNVKHMGDMLLRAAEHRGTSFVEIFQNCVIFNDGAWEHVTDKSIKDDNLLELEHDKPMIFGKDMDKGIILDGLDPKVVHLGDGYSEDDLLRHNESQMSPGLAYMLSQMDNPTHPVPIGVFRSVNKPVYNEGVIAQIQKTIEKKGKGSLRDLYFDADTWVVTEADTRHTQTTGDVTGELDEAYIDDIDSTMPDPGLVQHGLTNDLLHQLIEFEPVTVAPSISLREAITVMREKRIGSLMIVDDEHKLLGIFTEMDVLRRVACLVHDLDAAIIEDFMTPNPSSLKGRLPIAHALQMMSMHHFRHVPIVDEENHAIG
ncbi:MAG TPA: CBS domain-containing protein, partial [Aggregatilineales bacterium]|nr:CBS domain-containing protein [Aggregatilineales bacterium]